MIVYYCLVLWIGAVALVTIDIKNNCFHTDVNTMLSSHKNIDGIFALNDAIAMELLLSLKKMNISVPKDIKIIGFDDTPQDCYSSPTLSSVKQNTTKIALTAIDSLLRIISNPNETGNSILIPVSLVVRESSR